MGPEIAIPHRDYATARIHHIGRLIDSEIMCCPHRPGDRGIADEMEFSISLKRRTQKIGKFRIADI